ncbi:hypothetical protein CGRA01v4_07029 [Colletotrichum graminicola]|nr:hypothetical protein CGRA01v4_07029 [Colletotrichum graminicola]
MVVVPCRDATGVWLLSSAASQVGILVAKSQDEHCPKDPRPPPFLGHHSFDWVIEDRET